MGKTIVIINMRNRPYTFNVPGLKEAVHVNAARSDGDTSNPIVLTDAGMGPEIEHHQKMRDIRISEVA